MTIPSDKPQNLRFCYLAKHNNCYSIKSFRKFFSVLTLKSYLLALGIVFLNFINSINDLPQFFCNCKSQNIGLTGPRWENDVKINLQLIFCKQFSFQISVFSNLYLQGVVVQLKVVIMRHGMQDQLGSDCKMTSHSNFKLKCPKWN